jgi:hypothetical protein
VTTFALIHGAGDSGWYWHLVEPALREREYDVVAPDLPADESANLQTYADTVIEAIGDRTRVVVVAQSFGAFTAPLVSDRIQTVPRPPDRGEDEQAATDPPPGEVVGHELGDLREGEDHDEIEEELQRRDPPLALGPLSVHP